MAQTSFTHAQLEALWIVSGGAPDLANTAAAVAQAESGGCLYAKHGPTDDRPTKVCTYTYSTGEDSYGLWQINRQAHPSYSAASLYTPTGNAHAAVTIATGSDPFHPWTQYRNGAYLPFLSGAGPAPPTGPTGPTSPTTSGSPSAVAGWAALNREWAVEMPRSLAKTRKLQRETLRLLK